METLDQQPEKAILVGICRDPKSRALEEGSLRELSELVHSAGAVPVGVFLQEKTRPDPAYLVGEGKLAEIQESVFETGADLVVFDLDLSPAQLRNLSDFLETKVVDRSELILDIFAQRARSREGKLQVELAQLEYLLPRLSGRGIMLSRLGGGIGTRGPGETKLEVDRRKIRTRIARIRRELEKLERRRALHRQKRKGIPIPMVSLVGYTNAGKSTLFNRLNDESTYASHRMFATLDPLVRKLTLQSGQEVLLSDTVGFIRKLPHTLVAAFRATLEELLEADLVLHVIDVSQENFRLLRDTVYEVLQEIGLTSVPILEVYNKTDLVEHLPVLAGGHDRVAVSARSGEGLRELCGKIEEWVSRNYCDVQLTIPFDRGEILSRLRERARIRREEYGADGIHLWLDLPRAELNRYREFLSSGIS